MEGDLYGLTTNYKKKTFLKLRMGKVTFSKNHDFFFLSFNVFDTYQCCWAAGGLEMIESSSPGQLKLSLDQQLGKGKNRIPQLQRAILSTLCSVQQIGEYSWLLPACGGSAETSELGVLQPLCWCLNLHPADCPSAKLPGLEA